MEAVFETFPQLRIDAEYPYYMEWEKTWAGCVWWSGWLGETLPAMYMTAVLYVVVIFGLRDVVMPRMKAFDLWPLLALWNLGLSVFSTYGALRTVPALVRLMVDGGWRASVCGVTEDAWCESNVGHWVFLFIVSKMPELVDTLFLALRKKPIIFLHWYHHITVMIFCWWAGHLRTMTGLWFAAMNLCVHSIMYFYYFTQAIGLRGLIPGMPITILQISQMVMGIVVVISTAYYRFYTPAGCNGHNDTNIFSALAMYFSYFLLFVHLFYNHYISPKGKKAKSKKE